MVPQNALNTWYISNFLYKYWYLQKETVPGNFLFYKSLSRAACGVKRAQPIVGSDGAPFKTKEAAPVDERQISI